MSDDIRKQMLLKHLDKVNDILDSQKETNEREEENDTFGDLPSMDKIKRKHSHGKIIDSESDIVPSWKAFFDSNEKCQLEVRNFSFNLYYTLPKVMNSPSVPIFLFHHGAGSSGLSFANLAKEITSKLDGKSGCFSFDARGHGGTRPIKKEQSIKYDRDAFVEDFVGIIEHLVQNILSHVIPQEKISLILVGHSLGGSICTYSLEHLSKETRKKVLGIAMLDIVEEAAIQALQKVQNFLYSTPNSFDSYHDAIEWHINHDMSKLRASAEIAIPALFTRTKEGDVVRITNLETFTPYWDTWFAGLSQKFVSAPTCKLLILAGNDNLDKDLIIGQMQGKYQLVVFQDSGHFIQEDAPMKTALTLIDFWRRNDNKNIIIQSNWGKTK